MLLPCFCQASTCLAGFGVYNPPRSQSFAVLGPDLVDFLISSDLYGWFSWDILESMWSLRRRCHGVMVQNSSDHKCGIIFTNPSWAIRGKPSQTSTIFIVPNPTHDPHPSESWGYVWIIGYAERVMSYDLGVSKNNGTPKSSILIWCSLINHPFWGTSIFGNTHLQLGTFQWFFSSWCQWWARLVKKSLGILVYSNCWFYHGEKILDKIHHESSLHSTLIHSVFCCVFFLHRSDDIDKNHLHPWNLT